MAKVYTANADLQLMKEVSLEKYMEQIDQEISQGYSVFLPQIHYVQDEVSHDLIQGLYFNFETKENLFVKDGKAYEVLPYMPTLYNGDEWQ